MNSYPLTISICCDHSNPEFWNSLEIHPPNQSNIIQYNTIPIWSLISSGTVHKWCHWFFEIFDPSLPHVTHFIKQAYEVTLPLCKFPLSLSGWRHLWMVSFPQTHWIHSQNVNKAFLLEGWQVCILHFLRKS